MLVESAWDAWERDMENEAAEREYQNAMRENALTIHHCSNCGHHEGETIQAGYCPRCRRASEPIPIRVQYVREDQNQERKP